jgi:hypothetical protein
MSERVMRASDQDREEAILALSDAFADGRLDHAEFETRMASAQLATYLHDLDPLFADLPSRTKASEVVHHASLPGRMPPRPPFVPFLLIAVLTTVLVATGHVWVLIPLWFFGFSVARRMAWRRHSMAYAALPAHSGPHGSRRQPGHHGS